MTCIVQPNEKHCVCTIFCQQVPTFDSQQHRTDSCAFCTGVIMTQHGQCSRQPGTSSYRCVHVWQHRADAERSQHSANVQEVANQAGAAISRLTGFTDGGFREALVLETPLVAALVAYLDGSASHVQYHAAAALIALAGADGGACRQQVGQVQAPIEPLLSGKMSSSTSFTRMTTAVTHG